jgi:C1A family cysteine protease
MTRKIQRYGWQPDLPDHRDHLYAASPAILTTLPAKADLRSKCPVVYDQGQLGSCTANSIAAAVEFDQMKQRLASIFVPSRLFIYYNERAIEGTVASDSGAMIRDGIKSIAQQGVCPEPLWPYNISKFAVKPPAKCYSEAAANKAISYQRLVQNLDQFKGCLASGFPFVFGFTVYEEFESAAVAKTGLVQMPAVGEKPIGGHAVLAVGYDDTTQRFTVRNSWGSKWGIKGYFTIPYAYLVDKNLSSDFWTVRVVQ